MEELTYRQVQQHANKKDLYVVIHDKIYNATSFIDEHPGGEEVLLDVGGQDATEAFEDVGHSDEAREILAGMHVGKLKRVAGDPEPVKAAPQAATGPKDASSPLESIVLYALLLIGAALAFGAYKYMQTQDSK